MEAEADGLARWHRIPRSPVAPRVAQARTAHPNSLIRVLARHNFGMSGREDLSTEQQLEDLATQVHGQRADIEALQSLAEEASRRAEAIEERADLEGRRVDALEARADVDREIIRELQAEGLVDREHARNLEAALQTSRVIGAAVGITMAFHGVTETMAFELLRKASNDRNCKLRSLAQQVVLTGDVRDLQPPSRRPDPRSAVSGQRSSQ